jgi:hypothetical protein
MVVAGATPAAAADDDASTEALALTWDAPLGCPPRAQVLTEAGTRSVQTGACGSLTCVGYPDPTFTCASGKVCIVTAGGAISATCANNGCGAGAVSNQCVAGASGCTMNASTSGVTFTCNTCPQGGCP